MSTNEMRRHNWRIQLMATTNTTSRSPHRCQVMSGSCTILNNSDNNQLRDTQATCAVLNGRSLYEFQSADKKESRSEAWEWKKWVNRVLEVRTGGKLSIGRCFLLLLLFSSLLHTLLLHWISAWYKWHCHGFYYLRISVNGRWTIPLHQIHWKAIILCQLVAGHLSLYKYICGMIV